MSFFTGLDIGGTKIAGATFDEKGREIAQIVIPTPGDYSEFVTACKRVVGELDQKCGARASVGIGAPYAVANMPFLVGKPLRKDFEQVIGRPVRTANDANCLALAEAVDGAGAGYPTVFGLIMGTGVGGGFIVNGKIVEGANGLAGEIGHVPLPCYEPTDGVIVACGCGRKGCIESFANGSGLTRLYEATTGRKSDAKEIAALAEKKDKDALYVLDRFYTIVAKAMVAIIHTFDPDVIVVSGGLNGLSGMYDEVPKRWGQFALTENPRTKFVPAKFGAMAGLRGAAWLWK